MAENSKRATEQRLIEEEGAGWWEGVSGYVRDMARIGRPVFGNGQRKGDK